MMKKKGITVFEVVVAVGLIALTVGGIIGVLVQNIKTGRSIDYAYVSINLAKGRIEKLREVRRDRGYNDLPNWAEDAVPVDRNGVYNASGDFERTTLVNPNYASNLTQVTVRVNYKLGGALMPVATEITSLLSQYYE